LKEVHMEVVVTGRHCEVSDRFREHVSEKLSRLEKHDHRIMRVQVEVELEKNPRQHDRSTKVELTAFSKGPVIRAEAAAEDKMGALAGSTSPRSEGTRGSRGRSPSGRPGLRPHNRLLRRSQLLRHYWPSPADRRV
jgi:ribosomal subunit interface protein